MVNILGEDPTKITNAGIVKQIILKPDYVYKIENMDLQIGDSGVLLHYYSILKHVDVPDTLGQCMRYSSTF